MTVLVDAIGAPLAPPSIREGLKRVDERLDVLHVKPSPAEYAESLEARPKGKWMIIIRWRANDPRRGMIQRGEMNPDDDFDRICDLPYDCSIEEAVSYLQRGFRSYSREESRFLLDHISEFNRAQQLENEKEVREFAEEILDANKGNADFTESMGVGTVVVSAGGIGPGPEREANRPAGSGPAQRSRGARGRFAKKASEIIAKLNR